MAKKQIKAVKKTRTSKLKTVQAKFDELKLAVGVYFQARRYQQPEAFSITLPAKTDDKDTMIRVSSLMSSVLTATGFGKEARVIAKPAEDGGTLLIQFFTPVPKPEAIDRILYISAR